MMPRDLQKMREAYAAGTMALRHGGRANRKDLMQVDPLAMGHNKPRCVKSEFVSEKTLKLYGSRIGPKLRALVSKKMENPQHTDVREELAHIRAVHEERFVLWNTVLETNFPDTPEGRANRDVALTNIMSVVDASAKDIISACEKVAKIDVLAAGNTSPYAIDSVVTQIQQFVWRIFDMEKAPGPDAMPAEIERYKEAKERLRMFEAALDTELELPSLRARGTTITPDQQVLAMDSMIPTKPE